MSEYWADFNRKKVQQDGTSDPHLICIPSGQNEETSSPCFSCNWY